MQMRFYEGKEKALTLSYDDGQIHDIRLIEIMNKYGIKGTFNLNAGLFFKDGRGFRGEKSLEETQKIYAGHEIAVHGLTHPWTVGLPEQEMLYEAVEDRRLLEKAFGGIVRGMAYPFGCCNDTVVAAIKAAGIVYSRTTESTGGFNIPHDWLRLPATCHHNDPELTELATRFVNNDIRWGKPELFYLWGHSYEFANADNWEIIENFCALVSGKENIWYATNIEIYDYVKAFEALRFSWDKTTVYNPNALPVWFNEGGKTYKILPGETLITE